MLLMVWTNETTRAINEDDTRICVSSENVKKRHRLKQYLNAAYGLD